MTCAPAAADDPRPKIRIDGPADLVDLLPYLVGRQPADSMAVVCLRPSLEFGMLLRLDRLRAEEDGAATALAEAVRDGGTIRVVLVLYAGPDVDRPACLDLLTRWTEEFRAASVRPFDALLVRDGRWQSAFCGDDGCCPPDGRPVLGPAARVAAIAEAAGLAAPDPAELAELLAPVPDDERAAFAAAVARAEEAVARRIAVDRRMGPWRTAAARRLRQLLDRATTATAAPSWGAGDAAARTAVGLSDPHVRDAAWRWMESAAARPAAVLELWLDLSRRAPDAHRPAPLFLTAWSAWRAGRPGLARTALDLLHELDPGHVPAALLDQALVTGLDPAVAPMFAAPGRIRLRTPTAGRSGRIAGGKVADARPDHRRAAGARGASVTATGRWSESVEAGDTMSEAASPEVTST